MTPRRLAALEALAARGATEGERAAARNALDAYRAEQAKQREQPRSHAQQNADAYTRLLNDLFRTHTFAQEYNVVFPDEPYRPPSRVRYQPQSPKPPTSEPRVTQIRRATATDFPELLTATADPSNPDVLIVEFATAAQMWDRFNNDQTWRVLWQGFVWDAPKPCGVLHDRAQLRFYVKIDRRKLWSVTLPA